MKHKPHNLTSRLALVSAALPAALTLYWSSHGLVAQEDAAPAVAAIPSNRQAADVLEGVREKLDSLETLQCELYETVHLSDQRFLATGRYSQASGNRVRLEYQIYPIRGVRNTDAETLALDAPPEDPGKQKPTGEFSQTSDGGVLWTLWKNGDNTRLTRRNIREILEAADQAKTFEKAQMLEDLGAGGLQALLARLQTGMEFGKVREQTAGQTRLLLLSGRWTEESRRQYFNITDPETPMPAWLPDYVRLYVDAEAMLPRRIQYLKKHPNPNEKMVRPLITLDFRKMRLNVALAENWFVFTAPEGVAEDDLTQQTVDEIKRVANAEASQPDVAAGGTDGPVTDDDSGTGETAPAE